MSLLLISVQLVEIQQTNEPKVTIVAPSQKDCESVESKIHIEIKEENIGLKYESVTNSVILP